MTVTSLARYRAALACQVLDRVPVIPVLHVAAASLIDATIGQYAQYPEVMAETVINAYRYYDLDGVQLSLGVATEASALGVELVQPPDGLPKVTTPSVKVPGDLATLRIPDPERDGIMPVFLEALDRVMTTIGQEACVMAVIRGPMNIASQIRGVQNLMFDLMDAPDFAAELLAFCNQVALALGQAVIARGAHVVVIGEAICSPHFISPRFYRQHVLGFHRELCQQLAEMGGAASLMHICGDIHPILADMATIGAHILDLDWQVPVDEARHIVGPDMVLRGNVDPVAVMHDGTPQEVYDKASESLAQADPGGRFILCSGCDIPPGTPQENIRALVEAARTHGKGAR